MTDQDWADSRYVRVYATLPRDHPVVWADPVLLGWYVRLLMRADQAWPGLADLPAGLPDALIADEVIDVVPGGLYRFHGLDQERNGQRRRGHAGGVVRASSAPRDPLGRFAGGSNGDAGPALDRSLVSSPDDDAGSFAGRPATVSSDPATDETDDLAGPLTGPARSTSYSESSRGRARGEPGVPLPLQSRDHPNQGSIECSDYQGHAADHRWIEGVGWRCIACERVRAQDDLTFSEKVARAGGDAW